MYRYFECASALFGGMIMEILDSKHIELAQSAAAAMACGAAQLMLSCMVMNRGLTVLMKWISLLLTQVIVWLL